MRLTFYILRKKKFSCRSAYAIEKTLETQVFPQTKNRSKRYNACSGVVRVVGVEPTRLAAQEPKSCTSANSAIPADHILCRGFG